MANSGTSRLLRFNNNAALQNLIRHNLLRPAVGAASYPQLIKPQFPTNPADFSYLNNFADKKSLGYGVPLSMLAFSGVDRSGISKIHSRPVQKEGVDDYDDDDDDSDEEGYEIEDADDFDDGEMADGYDDSEFEPDEDDD